MCCVRTQQLSVETWYSLFSESSLRPINRSSGLDISKSLDLSDMKPGFDLPQNATVFNLKNDDKATIPVAFRLWVLD